MVCDRWCVTKLCVKEGVCVSKLCVTKMVCERECVKDDVCDKVEAEAAEAEEAEAGYRNNNKNPTEKCGEKIIAIELQSW